MSLFSLYPTNTHVSFLSVPNKHTCLFSLCTQLTHTLCPAADYVSLTTELTFEVMSTQCVTITITDNDVTEPEETFSVTLVPVSDFVTLGDPPSSSVVIEDDDSKSHWWSKVLLLYSIPSTAVSVSMFVLDDEFDEEDGARLVCVTLSEGQLDGITATVALSTSDETATSPSESALSG